MPETRDDGPGIAPAATLAYGADSPNQVLDLYTPGAGGPWPLVLAIHGGAFMMGDRRRELAHLPALLAAGYAVAAVEYRFSGEALFPAAVRDVKQAAGYLRAHAAELNLDPSFFAAWGRSAGGHLSAMLGVTSGQATEFDATGSPDAGLRNTGLQSTGGDSSVQAVIDWYGPSDFLQMDAQFIAGPPDGDAPPVQNHDEPGSPESRWIGGPIQELPAAAARANPITYITEAGVSIPPFFLAAGTSDHLVPYQQTLVLADALRAHGTPVELCILAQARHADQRFESELTGQAIDWLGRLRTRPRDALPVVFGVGHRRAPVRCALGDRQVGHEMPGAGPVPVLLAVGSEDDVAWVELYSLLTPGLRPAAPLGHVEGLAAVVGVPVGAGTGREVHGVHRDRRRRQSPGDRVHPCLAGERLGRALGRRRLG
jgi:acetyl esterase/lipase